MVLAGRAAHVRRKLALWKRKFAAMASSGVSFAVAVDTLQR